MANIIGQRIPIPQIAAPQAAQAQLLSVPADAPSPVGSLGGLFKSMAAPFMDTASADYKRAETLQALARTGQINQGVTGLKTYSDLIAAGTPTSDAAIAAAALGGVSAPNVGGYGRIHVYNDPNVPIGSDLASRASLAAGDPYSATVAGTTQAQEAQKTIEIMREAAATERQKFASEAQARSQERIAGFEQVSGVWPDGTPGYVSRADLAAGRAPGFAPMQGKDQVVGGLLLKAIRDQTGGAAPGAGPPPPVFTGTPPAAPSATLDLSTLGPTAAAPTAGAAPATAPTAARTPGGFDPHKLPYWLQREIGPGVAPDAIPYIETKKNLIGQSFDGGRTVTLADGTTVPATSGNWAPSDRTTAVNEARAAQYNQGLTTPSSYGGTNPLKGQIAQAAYTATGITPALKTEANKYLGAFGGGEIYGDVQQSRQVLDQFKQRAAALLSESQNKSAKEMGWIRDTLIGGNIFANPETAANSIQTINSMLLRDVEYYKQAILNLPTNSPLRNTYSEKLLASEQLLNTIHTPGDIIAPPKAKGAARSAVAPTIAPTAPAPTAAPAAATPATVPPTGAPSDAKQAPDGNWYSPDPARPGKYLLWK